MTKTVVAIYNSMEEAQSAATQLLSNGFRGDNVDVSSGKNYAGHSSDEEESGITRFFKNLFGNSDDNETERYTKVAERGSIVTVHAQSDEEATRASRLLDDYGAVDVDENYRDHTSGNNKDDRDYNSNDENYDNNNKNYENRDNILGNRNENDRDKNYENEDNILGNSNENDRNKNYENRDNILSDSNENFEDRKKNTGNLDENKTIPVIQEDVKIGKKEVATGGMRIRSRIIEKPVEENLRLREEHVHIERNKVDRPATEDELKNFRSGSVELTANSEIADVQKTSRVVEEVSLGKEVKHRDETVRDNVRSTEVDVENIEDANIESDRRNRKNRN